jgi:hypothetical protein
MAKSQSPLFGIDASGAIGDTVVYGKWKGIKYARRYVVPANPRTAEQVKTRSVFTFLNQLWVVAPSLLKEPFAAYASGKPLTDRNAFIQHNIPNLREADDLSTFVASPGVLGGFPLTALVATPGSGSVTAEAGVPNLPAGWTVDHVAFIILSDQDPHDDWTGVILAQADTTSPYSVTFTGLAAGDYRVTAYARYTRPDGKKAYSPSRILGVTVS